MNIIGIIPTRMASSRFPGKPLKKICGIPMVGHVYYRSKKAELLNDVYVATCDNVISEYMNSIGGKTIMTSNLHERASDRTAEAILKIEQETKKRVDIIVMIQGDEPMLFPEMINESVQPLLIDENISIVNLMSKIHSKEEQSDPNEVKVVVDCNSFALYFSREAIPSWKKGAKELSMFKQVCIIPFRRDYLIKFNELESTPLEIAESVDMLRVLEHGYKVKMVNTKFDTYSVDTIQDLQHVEKLMKNDNLIPSYSSNL